MKTAMMALGIALVAHVAHADPLACNLSGYKPAPGLTAAVVDDTLVLTWDGESAEQVRLRLSIQGGTPTIRDIAVRRRGGAWAVVAANARPEFRVVSGLRRMAGEQIAPLRALGVEITSQVVDREKWNAFWDAPLRLPGDDVVKRGGFVASPPVEGVAHQPGLPRRPEEIRRATAVYRATGCTVNTNGARLEVSFPGVELGVFAGRLEYTVYRGTNLIRQAVIAKTDEPSVAYKYDAGLTGLAVEPTSRMVWRDISHLWQDYRFGGASNTDPVPVKASNRIIVAEGANGSIAAFPPPHTFFWAREIEFNLGYTWYRKEGASFAFGVRQAETEEDPHSVGRGEEDIRPNFALYSARPGTWQRMPMYLYVSAGPAPTAIEAALAFTRQDRFKPLPGYQVMATHFHTGLVRRLRELGSLDAKLPDLEAVRATGINIFGPIDGGAGGGGDRLAGLAAYYDAARRHSDRNFLILPEAELFAGLLGGHSDLLPSKPLFWTNDRKQGQPFVEPHPLYGRVYHVGSAADLIEMARRENALLFIPHPRTKTSTGYPDAVKETTHFRDEHYRGIRLPLGHGPRPVGNTAV